MTLVVSDERIRVTVNRIEAIIRADKSSDQRASSDDVLHVATAELEAIAGDGYEGLPGPADPDAHAYMALLATVAWAAERRIDRSDVVGGALYRVAVDDLMRLRDKLPSRTRNAGRSRAEPVN